MIPKIIHYIWLGGKPLPKIAEKCIASWKKYCPDYEIKRWDETNLNISQYQYAQDAYDAKKYAFASDVMRFDVLYKYGGVYVDIDVEILKPIDDLLDTSSFTGFEKNEPISSIGVDNIVSKTWEKKMNSIPSSHDTSSSQNDLDIPAFLRKNRNKN